MLAVVVVDSSSCRRRVVSNMGTTSSSLTEPIHSTIRAASMSAVGWKQDAKLSLRVSVCWSLWSFFFFVDDCPYARDRNSVVVAARRQCEEPRDGDDRSAHNWFGWHQTLACGGDSHLNQQQHTTAHAAAVESRRVDLVGRLREGAQCATRSSTCFCAIPYAKLYTTRSMRTMCSYWVYFIL